MLHKQFLAIFIKNFNLLLSAPIFLVLNLTTVGVLFLISCLPTYAIDDHHIFLRDQGQATIFFMGCLTCVFCLIKVVTEDFRSQTISMTLSRPINSFIYCLATLVTFIFFIGLMQVFFQANYLWMSEMANDDHYLNIGSLVMFVFTVLIALFIPAFKQYFFRGRYSLPANLCLIAFTILGLIIRIIVSKEGSVDWVAFQNSLMILIASITFICFLFPFAIIYSNSSVMIIGLSLFFFGTLSEYIFTQLNVLIPYSFLKSLNAFVPNWQIFWIIERINEGHTIPISYYVNCFVHTAFVLSISLVISTLIVKKVELAK